MIRSHHPRVVHRDVHEHAIERDVLLLMGIDQIMEKLMPKE